MVQRSLYLKKMMPFVDTDVIKVITGIRRCGKSVLLEQIQQEILRQKPSARIVSINLEDDENKRFLEKGVLYSYLNLKSAVGFRKSPFDAIIPGLSPFFPFSPDG